MARGTKVEMSVRHVPVPTTEFDAKPEDFALNASTFSSVTGP